MGDDAADYASDDVSSVNCLTPSSTRDVRGRGDVLRALVEVERGHMHLWSGLSLPPALARKVRFDPNSGCWEWTGARDSRGYGNHRVGRSVRKAHRLVYEAVWGPVPPHLECDHLCRRHECVHPAHLEAVPHVVNVRRGAARWVPAARQRAKTHCPAGHEYTPANTYVRPRTRGRACRTCDRERKRARRLAQAPAALAA